MLKFWKEFKKPWEKYHQCGPKSVHFSSGVKSFFKFTMGNNLFSFDSYIFKFFIYQNTARIFHTMLKLVHSVVCLFPVLFNATKRPLCEREAAAGSTYPIHEINRQTPFFFIQTNNWNKVFGFAIGGYLNHVQ